MRNPTSVSCISPLTKIILRFTLLLFTIFEYNDSRNRRERFLTRSGVNYPNQSAWKKLLDNGDASTFVNITGFDFRTFRLLVRIWETDVEQVVLSNRGRPRSLDAEGEIGLLLMFLNRFLVLSLVILIISCFEIYILFCYYSTLGIKHLCLIFGIVPAVASRTINSSLIKMVRLLKNNPLAKISWPTKEQMKIYAAMVKRREPTVLDVIGFVDGCSIPTRCFIIFNFIIFNFSKCPFFNYYLL